MFYVLRKAPHETYEEFAVIGWYPDVGGTDWLKGRPLDFQVPQPLEYEVEWDYDASGARAIGRLSPFFGGCPPLMSQRLLLALADAGVDNIDAYEAVLKDEDGVVISEDYKAVNIIGKIAAADAVESKVAEGQSIRMIDTPFDSIVIDEDKTKGCLMFRLAEAVSLILIHETVKQHLEKNGFGELGFELPGETITL